WATLDLAADRRESYLHNIYRMGRAAIEKGRTEGPYAYIIPREQWDPFEAVNLVQVLMKGGVEVEQAQRDFTIDGKRYEKGSFVIYTAQAFRPYLMDLMEKQEYPTRFQYPGGPPETPYDLAGWTLPMQMGVEVDKITGSFKAPTEKVDGTAPYDQGGVSGQGSWGYAVSANTNAAVAVANKMLGAGGTVHRSTQAFKAGKREFPAGSFLLSGAEPLAGALAAQYGLELTALVARPEVPMTRHHRPKVGLYKSWVANMDEGWTRFLMDEYAFDMDTLHDRDIQTRDLSLYDAIILPSQRPATMMHGHSPLEMPLEYTGGLGLEDGLALSNFVKAGGTLIAFDQASSFVIDQFGLPLRDAVGNMDREKFFIPGSLIRTGIDTAHPLAYGMRDTVAVSFNQSRAFAIDRQGKSGEGGTEDFKDAPAPEVQTIATYAAKDLL